MRPVAGDHVPRPHPDVPRRGPDGEVVAGRVLTHPRNLVAPQDLAAAPAQRLPEQGFAFILREHQREGVGGGQRVEWDREEAPVPVAHAEVRDHDAGAQHLVDDAQGLRGFERPRVYDGRP